MDERGYSRAVSPATFDEHEFTTRIDAALRRIRTVLDNTRHPQYPADVPHRYDDKYLLAEVVTRVAAAALLQCLEVVGITPAQVLELRGWAAHRAVTLRLTAQESCRFLREVTRKVESAEERVTEVKGTFGSSTRSEKIITTVVEYFGGPSSSSTSWSRSPAPPPTAPSWSPRARGRSSSRPPPTNRRGPGPSSAHPSTST
jgi:hypothetical protein